MKASFNWKLWTGIAFSGLFLWLAFRKVDFREVGAAFEKAEYWFLIPSIAVNFAGLWIRSIRWGVLLRPIRKIRETDLFTSTIIGFMGNNLFPARAGEVLRAVVLGRKAGVSKSASFATIVLERMFDGATILVILAVLTSRLDLPFPGWLRKTSLLSAAAVAGLLVFLVGLKTKTDASLNLFGRLLKPFPRKLRLRLLDLIKSFVGGLEMLHDWKSIVATSLLSLFLWIFPALSIHFALLASDIHLPLQSAFFLLVVLCIGVAAPSAPGFVGMIQFVSVIGLGFFGVAPSQAVSYSILFHLSQYIPITALGLVFFLSEGFSFKKITADTAGGNGAEAGIPSEARSEDD
jgi:glycosyltransferase 2 family protein